jgi:hypothetical protein
MIKMKAIAVDALIGLGIAILVIGLLLFSSFDSTFIYSRF